MIKCAVPAVLGILALCLPLAAQTTSLERSDSISAVELKSTGETDAGSALSLYRSDIYKGVDGSVLMHGLPVLTLLEGRRFAEMPQLGRMGVAPIDFVPLAYLQAVDVRKAPVSLRFGTDTRGGVLDLRLRRDFVTGGEAGVFYGRSTGKYASEAFESYVIGTITTEKFQITAGASYSEFDGRGPRRGRGR